MTGPGVEGDLLAQNKAAQDGLSDALGELDEAKREFTDAIVVSDRIERYGEGLGLALHEVLRYESKWATSEHPAFQEIVQIGQAAVPLILEDLRRQPSWIFLALYRITNEDPTANVPRETLGDFELLDFVALKDGWLKWGEEKGYIQPLEQSGRE